MECWVKDRGRGLSLSTFHFRSFHGALATLGRMSPVPVRGYITEPVVASLLRPLQLTSPETNWTRSERLGDTLAFVRKRTIGPHA